MGCLIQEMYNQFYSLSSLLTTTEPVKLLAESARDATMSPVDGNGSLVADMDTSKKRDESALLGQRSLEHHIDPVFLLPECFKGVNHLQIDPESLKEKPIRRSALYYQEKASTTNSLTISKISGGEATGVLSFLPKINHLKLVGIILTDDKWNGYPTGLETLHIIDCVIVKNLMKGWLKALKATLHNVKVIRSYDREQVGYKISLCYLIKSLPHLRSVIVDRVISIKADYYCLLDDYDLNSCDDPDDDPLVYLENNAKRAIKTLVVRKVPTDNESVSSFYQQHQLWQFKNLQHLRIILPVDEKVMLRLQSISRFQTLDVFCYPAPKEPNNILLLNDDCLVKILSYLKLKDWIELSYTNTRFYQLLCQYIYPNRVIRLEKGALNDKYNYTQEKEVLKRIGLHVKSLSVSTDYQHRVKHFTQLKTLHLEHMEVDKYFTNEEYFDFIPAGLQKLSIIWVYMYEYTTYYYEELDFSDRKVYSFKNLFSKLSPTLMSLCMTDDFDKVKCLKELNQIRQLTLKDYQGDSIRTFLLKNKNHLEWLSIEFNNNSEFKLVALPKLKVIRLNLQSQNVVGLSPDALPSLKEIRITFSHDLNVEVQSSFLHIISSFTNLKILSVTITTSRRGELSWLYPLKNLNRLNLVLKADLFLNREDLFKLLVELPKLKALTTNTNCWSEELEEELRQFLIVERRKIDLIINTKVVLSS